MIDRGLLDVTGVGSLPVVDVDEAVEIVLEHAPLCPYWPQSAGTAHLLNMISQFFPEPRLVRADASGNLFIDAKLPEIVELFESAAEESPYAEGFSYPVGIESLERLVEEIDADMYEVRLLKLQITGPYTLGMLRDSSGLSLLSSERAMLALESFLLVVAKRMAHLAGKAGAWVWIQIDEPSFPAERSDPNTESAARRIESFVSKLGLFFPGISVGVHACGLRDISMLCELEGIDFISAEADNLQALPESMERMVAWVASGKYFMAGAVDTILATPEPSSATIATIANLISRVSFDTDDAYAPLSRILLSPNCGLAPLSMSDARVVLESLGLLRNALIRVIGL